MDKNKETALALRGILIKNGKTAFVRYKGSFTGTEHAVFENLEQAAGSELYAELSPEMRHSGYEFTVGVKDAGSFSVTESYDDSAENGSPSGVAVVTGGARGFGAGLVEALAEKGYFVYAADINLKAALEFAEKQNSRVGYTAVAGIGVNVSDETSVENMIDTVVGECGGLDLFVSNAGVLKAGSVKEMSLKDFGFVTDVDYTGFFICTKFASRAMAIMNKYCSGSYTDIIQINSKSGLLGSKKNGAYAGAKFGGIGLVQSFALELVEDRIKVNAICPGNFLDGPLWSDPEKGLFVQYLNTGKVPGAKNIQDVRKFYEDKVPMRRGCTIQDVVKALYYIIEQDYETGQALPVTGGQLMLH